MDIKRFDGVLLTQYISCHANFLITPENEVVVCVDRRGEKPPLRGITSQSF